MLKNLFFFAFLSIILSLTTLSSFAQRLQIGPRVGLNLSSLKGLPDGRIRPGTTLGIFTAYNSGNVGFSADILLSSKGGRTTREYTTNTSSEIWDSYSNLLYLEVPVLASIFLSDDKHQFRPKLFAGPALAFKLSATESMDYKKEVTNNTDTSFSSNHVVSDNYKHADFGCMIGAGFNYQMSSRAYFNFDARYTIGLVDIDKTILINDLYNRNIALYLGISYQIGK